jgi:diguanylate cyclase
MNEPPSDPAGAGAKETLIRLAKERLALSPENYCRTYRRVASGGETWNTYCRYTGLLEEALFEVIGPWQTPGPLVEPETARIARELGRLLAAASSEDHLKTVRDTGQDLGARIHRDLATGSELQSALVGVLQLVIADLGTASNEDEWLGNQILAAEEFLGGHVSAMGVANAREILLGMLARQRQLPQVMAEAQQALKAVVADLIRQAMSLIENTTGYERKVAELGEHIQAAEDLASIKGVVSELGLFVRDMGDSVRRSHEEMSASHTRLLAAEEQIAALRNDLSVTGEKVRRDALTGALNRSGLEEIWQREIEHARGNATPLSVGMLDVDNFKLLNDRYGHSVGDDALVHLTSVIRNALHGADTIARYGGEEFVILLPDTDGAGAEGLMRRLQRELTKRFFLHNNERLLITFSAGVTVVDVGTDSLRSVIERADSALYTAKRLGKNRVAKS